MRAAWGLGSRKMEGPGRGGVRGSEEPAKLTFLALAEGVWDGNWIWLRDEESLRKGCQLWGLWDTAGLLAVPFPPDVRVRFFIRGCGQYNSFRCQEKRSTYVPEYWYQAECCQYDYCNAWASPQLQSALPGFSDESLALPLSASQIQWFYQALNLSLPLPSFHAGKAPEGPAPQAALPLNLSLPIAELRRVYLFLNRSGLLVLPQVGP